MDDELMDLVDRDDKVIGTINRMDSHRLREENLGYIRVSELFIVNSKGRIYIPVRTANKTIAPNGYDYSAGGHVEAGDDYVSTIIRETAEELNLSLTDDDLEAVGKMISDDIRYIRRIFIVRRDETPTFNPQDFVSAEWLTPEEVIQKIDEGHSAKSTLRATLVLLKDYLKEHPSAQTKTKV